MARTTPGVANPTLAASVARIKHEIARTRQEVMKRARAEVDREWERRFVQAEIDAARDRQIVEQGRTQRAREAEVMAQRIARGDVEDPMATAVKRKGTRAANAELSSEEKARKAKVRNRAWKRARNQSQETKRRFVADWDAGKIDWKALEKQFAEEDAGKREKPQGVGARVGTKTAARGKTQPAGKPKAKANGNGNGKAKASPKASGRPAPATGNGKRDARRPDKPTTAEPYTKEAQLGKTRTKNGGDRKAIQRRMGNGQSGKDKAQATADANLKAAESTGDPDAVTAKTTGGK